MASEFSTSSGLPEIPYISLFDALPGNSILLEKDAPRFTIVAVTPQYLMESGMKKEALIGKGLFEVFPPNPDNPDDTGERNLRDSLNYVLQHKVPHQLAVQRYDILSENGIYVERYWKTCNTPVFDNHCEIAFIINSGIEITDQVKAARLEERMKGMELAQRILMQAPTPIQIYKGSDLILTLANEPTLAIWGKGPEIVGKPLKEAVPEIQGQGFTELLLQVMETCKPVYLYDTPTTFVVNGKEEVCYFNTVYQPYYEQDKRKAVGVLVFGFDVTQKVLAEQKAAESEDRFRVLADQAPMMVFMADADAEVTYCSSYWLKYTGQNFERALGRAWEEVVHPEDYKPLLKAYLFSTSERQSYSVEARIRRWDGQYRYFLFTGGPRYSPNGTFLGNIGSGVDIHDRKQAERALMESERNLRSMILQSPVAMCILRGPEFVVEIANDRMYELWGRGEESLLHKSLFEGLPEVCNQGYEEILNRVYTTGETFTANGIPVTLARNGFIDTLYINVLHEAFREGDGTISGIMVVATDVTSQVLAQQKIEEVVRQRTCELARVNEELIKSNQELSCSNAHLAEFAYAASHDLKEPIRTIRTFSERIKDKFEKSLGDNYHYFERVEKATVRMQDLIDDLLEYSVVSSTKNLEDDIDLSKTVAQVLEDLELEITEKKANVTVGSLPVIKGNRRQIQQLFQNLITNALKFSKPGIAPEIRITSSVEKGENLVGFNQLKEDKLYHLVKVADNGIGFKQEYGEQIFKLFQRLHGKSEFAGTGIGLAIVRKVVETHGGYVTAEGKPNEGATFKVLLPVER